MKLFTSKKLVAGLAIGFGIAAVSSTALAAYIVTGGNKTGNIEQNPTDVVIKNEIVNLNVQADATTLDFAPDIVSGEARLNNDTAGDMTLGVTLTATTESKDLIKDVAIEYAITYTAPGEHNLATNYITHPATSKVTASQFTGSETTYKATVDLTWGWGSEFETTDPCTYANGKDEETLSNEDLVAKMNEFKATINNIANITITFKMA